MLYSAFKLQNLSFYQYIYNNYQVMLKIKMEYIFLISYTPPFYNIYLFVIYYNRNSFIIPTRYNIH